MPTQITAHSILGPDGKIAQRLRAYELRPEQLKMADAVAAAIAEQRHLIVEAGTGVGKSFAYLVPAILAATANQRDEDSTDDEEDKRKRTRVVISTHTISLQEQLIARDIPFLNAVIPLEFSAVLVKGRSNYVSLRRMKGAVEKAGSLFHSEQPIEQLGRIVEWSNHTTDGSKASLDFSPLPEVWSEVQSEHGNCLGKKCPTYEDCHYYAARRRVWNADILVVNHALFFSDLALRREGASILPDYDVVVFDEAHTLEAVASDHLGVSISSGQVEYLLNRLYSERQNKGLLTQYPRELKEAQELVVNLRFIAQDFFDAVRFWQQTHGQSNGRVKSPPKVDNMLSDPLRQIARQIALCAESRQREEEKVELVAAAERCVGLSAQITTWLGQTMDEAVYWVEVSGRKQERTELLCAPIDVAPVLREELFNKVKTCILTSATLSSGASDFHFVKERLGVTRSNELRLGSPFDFRSNVKLILPRHMPDPTEQSGAFESAVCECIKKYVHQTQGRAFVLFTSYSMLRNCATRLGSWLSRNEYSLYSQADGMPRTLLLERFRNDPRGVLFGADSFWQGVDVPGDALQNVIITKLPFSVPDHPLLEARLDAIRGRGGNPFMEYQVPEAIIKLKQGFGRLIRSKTDRGQVAILDPRVRTKRYGRLFLESLPECEVVSDDDGDHEP